MHVPLVRDHGSAAGATARQRNQWLASTAVEAGLLDGLERRLRVHVYVVSRALDLTDGDEPEQYEDVFVWLAARLSSLDDRRKEEAVRSLGQWLQEDAPRGEAAACAALLFAGPDLLKPLEQLYEDIPGARPALLDVFSAHGHDVTAQVVTESGRPDATPDFLAAALKYLCRHAGARAVDVYRTIYQPDAVSEPGQVDPDVLAAAIVGGLMAGDGAARAALHMVIRSCGDTGTCEPFLRIAALAGDLSLYPHVQAYAQAAPAAAYRLMALYGHPEAAEDLFEGLSSMREPAAAAEAWCMLSGQRLGHRPRLRLVGNDAVQSGGDAPDVEQAGRWLEDAGRRLASEGRVFGGAVASPAHLHRLAELWAGQVLEDILDMIAIVTRTPAGIHPAGWVEERRRVVARLSADLPRTASTDAAPAHA